MTFKPTLLLFQTWLAHPVRGCCGVIGIGLLVWSILPLFERSRAHTPLRFAGEMGELWRRAPRKATVGVVGVVLFFWSIGSVLTSP